MFIEKYPVIELTSEGRTRNVKEAIWVFRQLHKPVVIFRDCVGRYQSTATFMAALRGSYYMKGVKIKFITINNTDVLAVRLD